MGGRLCSATPAVGPGFPPEPRSSPDFQVLADSPGLRGLPDMFLVRSFHSPEAVWPTIEKAKVFTTQAEKEEGGRGQPECPGPEAAPHQVALGPFLATPAHPRCWAFLPSGPPSLQFLSFPACSPPPHRPPAQQAPVPQGPPSLSSLGSLQVRRSQFWVGGEHRADPRPSPVPRLPSQIGKGVWRGTEHPQGGAAHRLTASSPVSHTVQRAIKTAGKGRVSSTQQNRHKASNANLRFHKIWHNYTMQYKKKVLSVLIWDTHTPRYIQ